MFISTRNSLFWLESSPNVWKNLAFQCQIRDQSRNYTFGRKDYIISSVQEHKMFDWKGEWRRESKSTIVSFFQMFSIKFQKANYIKKKTQTSYWICKLGVWAQLINSKFGKISSCLVKLTECQIVRNSICIYPQFYASGYEQFNWTGHPACVNLLPLPPSGSWDPWSDGSHPLLESLKTSVPTQIYTKLSLFLVQETIVKLS